MNDDVHPKSPPSLRLNRLSLVGQLQRSGHKGRGVRGWWSVRVVSPLLRLRAKLNATAHSAAPPYSSSSLRSWYTAPPRWQEAWLSGLSCHCHGESVCFYGFPSSSSSSAVALRVCWTDGANRHRGGDAQVRVVLSAVTLCLSVTQLQRVVHTMQQVQTLMQWLEKEEGAVWARVAGSTASPPTPAPTHTATESKAAVRVVVVPFTRVVHLTAPSVRLVLVSSLHRPEWVVHVDCVALTLRERWCSGGGAYAGQLEATAELSMYDDYPNRTHGCTTKKGTAGRCVLRLAPELRVRWGEGHTEDGGRDGDTNTRASVPRKGARGCAESTASSSADAAAVSVTVICPSLTVNLPITALTRLYRLAKEDWALVCAHATRRRAPCWVVQNRLGVAVRPLFTTTPRHTRPCAKWAAHATVA